ncbi:hypothetical protein AHX51_26185 [Salmonella enterica subsp. diarizonae]|nr:hypothetical protein [Salmonella enterica subsp. diarizonae]
MEGGYLERFYLTAFDFSQFSDSPLNALIFYWVFCLFAGIAAGLFFGFLKDVIRISTNHY